MVERYQEKGKEEQMQTRDAFYEKIGQVGRRNDKLEPCGFPQFFGPALGEWDAE